MRYTLLKTVQLILSSGDGDEINDIGDTTESNQVVDICETVFNDLASTIDFPEQWDFFQLAATGLSTPTILTMADNIGKVEWVQYNIAASDDPPEWTAMTPLSRTEFFARQMGLDPDDTNVFQQNYTSVLSGDEFQVLGFNDKDPSYYTTLDDNRLIFDNYDNTKYTQLPGAQFRCYGQVIPSFVRQNDWVAPFEPRQFTLYFNEAKSQYWAELKQTANPKAEQRARRGWVQTQRKQPKTPPGQVQESWTPNFGRRGYK